MLDRVRGFCQKNISKFPCKGTQYCVEGDPGILLVSAHRYENGQFWPELSESDIFNECK